VWWPSHCSANGWRGKLARTRPSPPRAAGVLPNGRPASTGGGGALPSTAAARMGGTADAELPPGPIPAHHVMITEQVLPEPQLS